MSSSTRSMAFPQFRRRQLFPSSSSLHFYPFPSPPPTEPPVSPTSQSSPSTFQYIHPQTTTLSSLKTAPHFFLDSVTSSMEESQPNGSVTLRRDPVYTPADESAIRKIRSTMSLAAVLNAPSSTPPDCHSQTSEGAAFGVFESATDTPAVEEEKPASPPQTPPQVRCFSHHEIHQLQLADTLEDLMRLGQEMERKQKEAKMRMKETQLHIKELEAELRERSRAAKLATARTTAAATKDATPTKSTPVRRLSLRSSQTVSPENKKQDKVEAIQPKVIKLKFKNPAAIDALQPTVGGQLVVKRGRGRPRKLDPITGEPLAKKLRRAHDDGDEQLAIKRRKSLSGAAIKVKTETEEPSSLGFVAAATAVIAACEVPASPDSIRPRKRKQVDEPVGYPHIHRRQRIVTTSEERLPRPSMHEHSLGLSNLGATCYINVVVQLLAHTRSIREYFLACDFARSPANESSRRVKAKLPKPNSQCVRRTRASEKTAEVLFPKLKGKLGEEFGVLLRELLFDEEDGKKNGVASDQFWTALRANLEKEGEPAMDSNLVQDAHEFLILILQALSTEASTAVVDGYSLPEIIDSAFAGVHSTVFECNNCHATTRHEDKCMELEVPICKNPRPATAGTNRIEPSALEEHLRNYTLPEQKDWAPDAYVSPEGVVTQACPNCGVDRGRSMRHTVRPRGDNVCIELKRFLWENGENRKVRGHVAFPLRDLDLGICAGDEEAGTPGTINTTAGPASAPTDGVKKEEDGEGALPAAVVVTPQPSSPRELYDLYGVVVHKGDRSTTGHYIAFAKEGGQWLRFDDLKVHTVTEQEVAREEAYILMYEKKRVVGPAV